MGWNQGYEIMEATVVGAYDLGVLDKKLLKVLMEPYRDSDIDSGGSNDLTSKDGLNVEEIVLKTLGMRIPIRPNLPEDFSKWSEEDKDANDAYQDAMGEQFSKATAKYGW